MNKKDLVFYILAFGLILNFFFDGLNKIFNLYVPQLSRVAIVFRILFQLVCVLFSISFLNKTRVSWFIIFTYFLISFFIGNISLEYLAHVDISILEQFIFFNKYFFIFFIFFAVYELLKNKNYLEKVITIFKRIFVFNGFLAVSGLLFNIRLFTLFPSIGSAPRFGYDGLVSAINEASIFYLLGLFVYYYDWRYNNEKLVSLMLVVVFCLITGTKAVFLGMLLLLIYHVFSISNIVRLLKIGGVLTIIITVIIFNSNKLIGIFGYYYYYLIKKGFVFTFTGGRNTFIESRVIPLISEKWSWINYLTGGQNISMTNKDLALIEMDFLDLILFFGFLNSIIYFILFKKYIIGKIRTKYYFCCVSILLLLAFFSGHFFTSSVNPIYIIIVFSYINFKENENHYKGT